VRDFATGQVLPWAQELFVEAANAGCYIEWTVSGTGARIIGAAKGSKLHKKININRKTGCCVEFYRDATRYITISGLQISGEYPGLPIPERLPECDALFDTIYARFCDDQQRPAESACEFRGGLHITVEEIEEDKESEATPSVFDFNDAGPQNSVDYNNLIANGAPQGERSEEFQRTVWHLAAQGQSAEQIAEEFVKHPNGIGAKYAGRLFIEVQRSYQKWQQQRHTSATGGNAAGGGATASVGAPWPQIRVIDGEIPRVVAEAEAALLAYGCEIYQRGGLVVRPVLTRFAVSNNREDMGWQLTPVTRPYLVDVLTCAARFWKFNRRSKAWVPIDAPDKVAETYLARHGRWKLPVLSGIVHAPFLRADGSICEVPGYDAASGLLFKPEGEHYPLIPQQATKVDAAAALGALEDLIKTFPFVTDADRSVALSAILTTLDRRSMATAPLHAFTSPAAGTGKSLQADICATLATGRLMPVIAQGKTEEELEKRLGAALLAGDMAVSIDNCDHPLEGTFLCQALTQHRLNIRILGQSRNVETPVGALILATGNNLVLAGDLVRRALLCAMDARCERPELRTFNINAVELAKQRRGVLVTAALTVLRAWHVAGEHISLSAFGSFEQWSHRIRAPLVWLGKADPCDTIAEIRDNDPHRAELVAVIMQWRGNLQINAQYTVQEVIERAINVPSFYTALMTVAGSRSGQVISNERLGRWLKRVQGKMVGNLTLRSPGKNVGHAVWSLVQI
jgi:putative DNA primase/helicase